MLMVAHLRERLFTDTREQVAGAMREKRVLEQMALLRREHDEFLKKAAQNAEE